MRVKKVVKDNFKNWLANRELAEKLFKGKVPKSTEQKTLH